MRVAFAFGLAFCLAVPFGDAEAASSKNVRAGMSDKQKADLRKRAREWCQKKYAGKGQGYVERVEILSNGRVRCWIRG